MRITREELYRDILLELLRVREHSGVDFGAGGRVN